MKNEFQAMFDCGNRVRVRFRLLPEQRLTLCKIKYYKEATKELLYAFQGIAICYSGDEWNDKEGRKWAFIDALKCMMPLKRQIDGRKLLQKAYIKFEKEIERIELVKASRTDEDEFMEYLNSEDCQTWLQSSREADEQEAWNTINAEE